jgi:hypothetical protein
VAQSQKYSEITRSWDYVQPSLILEAFSKCKQAYKLDAITSFNSLFLPPVLQLQGVSESHRYNTKKNAMKSVGLMILLLGAAGWAMAAAGVSVPEIDPASAVGALALLSGALLVIRGHRRPR